MTNQNTDTDLIELYSFSTYLYLYVICYTYLLKQSFIEFIFINIIANSGLYYLCNYTVFNFINHNYWKNRSRDIAMPQLVSCISNVIINNKLRIMNNIYDYALVIPANILIFYFIKNMYKKEISESKNLRLIMTILFFLSYFF